MIAPLVFAAALLAAALAGSLRAGAQDLGTLDPKPLPPLANPNDPNNPAKELFGRKTEPAPLKSEAIGFYAKGCLAGGRALPLTGPTWQVMRLSRNRNWGHPSLVQFIERLSQKRRQGRLARIVGRRHGAAARRPDDHRPCQPPGRARRRHLAAADAGPCVHAPGAGGRVRHHGGGGQPQGRRSRGLDPGACRHHQGGRGDPLVERIFVNAAIKKKLCEGAGGDRAWLQKVRPYWDHDYHFHVRIKCPDDSPTCKHQDPVPAGDGCGKDLDWWFTDAVLHPKPSAEPEKPRPPIRMADLPPVCRQVLSAP